MPSLALATKTKLLTAAMKLVRAQGYAATSIDDLCQDAGVTKGAFFHYFKSKEDLAIAATRYWTEVTSHLFSTAPYRAHEDPLERLLAYIDFRAQLLDGRTLPEFTCLLGTMVQETYDSNASIRDACMDAINVHANDITDIITAAKARHAPHATWSAASLALHTQAVIQGGFILAKANNNADLARDSIMHLRRYIELLFQHAKVN